MGKLTHVYQKLRGTEQTPIGGNIEQVLYDIGQATLDLDDHTSLVGVVGGHQYAVEQFLEELGKYEYNPSRLKSLNAVLRNGDGEERDYIEQEVHVGARGPYRSQIEHFDFQAWLDKCREQIGLPANDLLALKAFGPTIEHIEITSHPARPASSKTVKMPLRTHLGTKKAVRAFVKNMNSVSVLVICEPDEEGGDLACLPDLQAACPHLDIVIFHEWCGQWGVEITGDADKWEEEFPVMGDCELSPPAPIVKNFILQGLIHVFAGRFETYKTMALIELCSAILQKRKAFDELETCFDGGILFLEGDMSPELFQEYCKPFGLMKQTDFRWQRPGGDVFHAVDSPVLQKAVRGRILILDTMLDYARIENAYESSEWVTFMQRLRDLMTIHGCAAVIMTAHATKTGAKSSDIDPSEYFKDSATFGGKVDIGYGFKALPGTSQIEIKRIKGRGFKKPLNFTIAVYGDDGESNLSGGQFPVYQKPGEFKKQGRPAKREPEMLQEVKTLKAEGKSNRDIGEAVGVSEKTVRRILKEGQEQTFDFNKEN